MFLASTISESSTVTLAIVGAIIVFGGGGVWWAASIQAKIDTLLNWTSLHGQAQDSMKGDISGLRDRVTKLEVKLEDQDAK
jgi:hypothetical protein